MDTGVLKNAAAILTSVGLAAGSTEAPILSLDCGTQFCKATPAIEGGERVLYMEASNEARDVQNERILAEALETSKDYFLKYGRIDLDHATVWQMIRETRLDPSNPYAREIGRPLDVRITRKAGDIPRVWVKAAIFKSSDPGNQFARAANWFWDTLQVRPPAIWYPSVAGSLLPGGREDGADGSRTIKKLRWHSIGFSRNPVNTGVQQVSTVPLEVFAKAMRPGTDLSVALNLLSSFKGAPAPADADSALRAAGIMVPQADGGSIPAGLRLTEDKAELIKQAILDARPPFSMTEWLARVVNAGITPAEGMAYLLALLGSGKQFALDPNPADPAASTR
jgi:hypothetical protein